MELRVQVKQPGKRQNNIISKKWYLKEVPNTVEDLIVCAVKAEYAAFRERQETAARSVSEKLSERQAVEIAIQAFEDGVVAVFIDGTKYENLCDRLELKGEETVTFVKLTMLTGRLW